MPGIGETLRDARIEQGLDIVDFEARTKIRAKYLRALEDEEWGLLPGYTFIKGFLRTYADMLGLDGRALLDEFKRQYRDPSELEPVAPASARRADPRRARERQREHGGERAGRQRQQGGPGRRPPLIIAVVVLVVLIGVALYAVGVLLPRNKTTTTATHTTQSGSHTTTTTTTHTARTHGPHRATVVGVQLLPTGTVNVCMIGYPGSSNRRPHTRIDGRNLVPGGIEPVYHDNHFHVTFGNSQIVLVVNRHRHLIAPSANPISLAITLHGQVLPLPASKAPHCP